MTAITLTGQVSLIKTERMLDKSLVVDFILEHIDETNRTHHFFLRAFTTGTKDRFGISELIGHDVTAECYLNGRKGEGTKGTFYSNELRVKTIHRI